MLLLSKLSGQLESVVLVGLAAIASMSLLLEGRSTVRCLQKSMSPLSESWEWYQDTQLLPILYMHQICKRLRTWGVLPIATLKLSVSRRAAGGSTLWVDSWPHSGLFPSAAGNGWPGYAFCVPPRGLSEDIASREREKGKGGECSGSRQCLDFVRSKYVNDSQKFQIMWLCSIPPLIPLL